MPDFFHCVHDIGKSYALAIGQQAAPRPAGVDACRERSQRLDRAQGTRTTGRAPCGWKHAALKSRAGARDSARIGSIWRPSRSPSIPSASTTRAPQTSTQVAQRLHAEVEAIEALAARHQFPACDAVEDKGAQAVARLGGPGGLLVDGCGAGFGARRPVDALEDMGQGVSLTLCLLGHQVARTRCARRKAKLRKAAGR